MKVKNLQAGCMIFALYLMLAPTIYAQPCANVSSNLTITPATASPGTTVVVSSTLDNCSTRPETFTVAISVSGATGAVYSRSIKIQLRPGEMLSLNVPLSMPETMPAGDCIVTETVLSGSKKVGAATASLTVT